MASHWKTGISLGFGKEILQRNQDLKSKYPRNVSSSRKEDDYPRILHIQVNIPCFPAWMFPSAPSCAGSMGKEFQDPLERAGKAPGELLLPLDGCPKSQLENPGKPLENSRGGETSGGKSSPKAMEWECGNSLFPAFLDSLELGIGAWECFREGRSIQGKAPSSPRCPRCFQLLEGLQGMPWDWDEDPKLFQVIIPKFRSCFSPSPTSQELCPLQKFPEIQDFPPNWDHPDSRG